MSTPMAEELGRAAMDDRRREAAGVALETAALDGRERYSAHVLTTTFRALSNAMSWAKLLRITQRRLRATSSERP